MNKYNFKPGDKVVICATISALYDIGIFNEETAAHILSKVVTVFKVEPYKIYIAADDDIWWVHKTWVKLAALPNEQLLLFELT